MGETKMHQSSPLRLHMVGLRDGQPCPGGPTCSALPASRLAASHITADRENKTQKGSLCPGSPRLGAPGQPPPSEHEHVHPGLARPPAGTRAGSDASHALGPRGAGSP